MIIFPRRSLAFALAWIIVALALPPVAFATDGTDGTSGPASLDADTDQLFDSQDPAHTIVTPRNTTKTETGHGTVTITDSDICTTGTQTGAAPCLDSGGHISTATLPPPYYDVASPVVVRGLGIGIITYTATVTGSHWVTGTASATGTGTRTDGVTVTATCTGTASRLAYDSATGSATIGVVSLITGTATQTQSTANIGNASGGLALFNAGSDVNHSISIDHNGNLTLSIPNSSSDTKPSGLNFVGNGGTPTNFWIYPSTSNSIVMSTYQLRVFGCDANGTTFLGGMSSDVGQDAPVYIEGARDQTPNAGHVYIRGTANDPTRATTSPLLSVGGVAVPYQFQVLGNGTVVAQNPVTCSGGLTCKGVTATGSGTATGSSTDTGAGVRVLAQSNVNLDASNLIPWTATGTGTGNVIMGSDGRLSDARTPTGSMNATSPIQVSGGTSAALSSTPTVSILAASSSTAGSQSAADKAKEDGIIYPHGWPLDSSGNRLVTTYYDPSTRKVTIHTGTATTTSTATSTATFAVWNHGVQHTENDGFTSAAHAATEGTWYYYWDGSNWTWSQTFWNLYANSPAAYVYWSSVGSTGAGYYELHGWNRDIGWHIEHHLVEGSEYISGCDLSGYTLNTDTDAAMKFSIAECKFSDEDIFPDNAALTAGTSFTVWRRSGASGYWTWSTANALPFLYGTYPQVNQVNAGSWAMVDLNGTGQGSYATYYVVTTDGLDQTDQRFFLVPGQVSYASLAAAQAETFSSLSLGTAPWQEFVPVAQVVLHARGTYGGTAKARIESVTKLTAPRAVATSGGANQLHNALGGLQGGTTGEYYHLTAAQDALVAAATTTPTASALPIAGTDSKLAIAWLPTGTATNSVVTGADSRLTDSRTPTGSINATGPVQLAAGTSTSTSTTVALANSPTVSINTGTGTNQVIMGNDTRLTDPRDWTGTATLSTFVPWTGTGTGTAQVVTGADSRLTNARAPTGNIYAGTGLGVTTGTGTGTGTVAALSASPTFVLTSTATGGTGNIAGTLTSGYVPVANGASSLANSHIRDNGTVVTVRNDTATAIGATPLAVNSNLESPGALLELSGQYWRTAGDWAALRFGMDTYPNQYAKAGLLFESRDGYGRGKLHLAVNNGATTANVGLADAILTVDGTTGRVGIGNPSPNAPLDITAASVAPLAWFRNSAAASYSSFEMLNDQNSRSREMFIGYAGSSYASALWTGGPVGESASIGSAGNYPLTFAVNQKHQGMFTDGYFWAPNTVSCSGGISCSGVTATGINTGIGTSTSTAIGVRPNAGSNWNIDASALVKTSSVTSVATASKIPQADTNAKLDTWTTHGVIYDYGPSVDTTLTAPGASTIVGPETTYTQPAAHMLVISGTADIVLQSDYGIAAGCGLYITIDGINMGKKMHAASTSITGTLVSVSNIFATSVSSGTHTVGLVLEFDSGTLCAVNANTANIVIQELPAN